jgi:hypothetical protein
MDLSGVRIREHFGLVSNDTNTSKFYFLISPPKNRTSIEKHDYVLVDHPILGEVCPVLAEVMEITSCEEVAGSPIGDKMGKMLATADIRGYIDLRKQEKPLQELLVPPCSGSRVYIPLKTFLEDLLNRDARGESFKTPVKLGTFEASSTEDQQTDGRVTCYFDAGKLFSENTLITGGSGTGKTYLAKHLIRETIAKTSAQLILFDPFGEYADFGKSLDVADKIDDEAFAKEITKNHVTTITTRGLSFEEKRTLLLDSLKVLLKLRWEEKIPPFFVLIEEADNLKGEMLNQFIAEGRKKGLFVALVTTHPAVLGSQILAEIRFHFIGRTAVKEDLEALAYIGGSAPVLSNLGLGEFILNGVDVCRSMKIIVK